MIPYIMNQEELRILHQLNTAVASEAMQSKIEAIAVRVKQKLRDNPDELLAWEPIPLESYDTPLPAFIRSSWVFILRANTNTGAERHPNSHQRMMSYRGYGDFQTRTTGDWQSNLLKSGQQLPIEERWISIPENVWHQGIVAGENWVVVSFHTAEVHELIEERPSEGNAGGVEQMKYEEKK